MELVTDTRFWISLGLVALIGYLLGSVNFAVVVSRLLYHDDVRNYGSGNAGMTNMLRTYGKKAAFLTGLGDFFKGTLAVIIGRWVFVSIGVTAFDGGFVGMIAVLMGHLFPLYFHFKGGKGILCCCGAILVLNPIAFLFLLVGAVPIAFITRIVSLASIIGAAGFPFLTYGIAVFRGEPHRLNTLFAIVGAVIVIYMHRENIKRLLNGTEKRIGKPRGTPEPPPAGGEPGDGGKE